ncbi:MAG: hypothetical protein Q7S35_09530, partial [Candidatus Limnocylindrales bacterium]|nr:hypothetical protein [Candidatus Limnocylindrales bacterium]
MLLVMRQGAWRESLVRALSGGGGVHARTAGDVREAAAMCETCQPQLLVVDLDWVGDAYRELLGRSALPAIGLTARHDTKTKLAAFAAGAD